ncbi:DnaJ domain-containing protein [Paludisphaera soli]|uniref:DnaJ domain-containing protein n=1 Tax=Paludisphaera soli TaxID=2712865 RepID=UPI00197EA200|nr:DnaJ domain-containing protein [Paludisphaera soli]
MDRIQDEEAAYACCSVGIGRWCWIVWASESDAREAAKPLATGYEKSAQAAESRAVESAGAGAKRLPSKWASAFKRGGPARTEEGAAREKPKSRLSRRAPAKADAPARLAFLYAASESEQAGSRGEVEIVKHRIVRQTAGKLYIDREPFREEEWHGREAGGPEAPKPRTLAVDRDMLRREGRVPHRGSYFYASEEKGIQGVHADLTSRHPWCAVLDVGFPCSTESIKAAYRRLAREKHPDAGGNPAEFQAVERAYREAVAYFSSPDDPAKPA